MALEIQKNSRQVPSVAEICSSKKYYDLLYSYLQTISIRDKLSKERYVYTKDVKYSRIGQIFGVSRQTIAKRFNNLIELGLVKQQNDRYILTLLPDEMAYLIPEKTLALLVDALSENAISTYIYLFGRYYANKEQPFIFTYEQIKKFIGIATTTKSNNQVVANILYVLQKIGLLEYELTALKETDNFGNIKTVYQVVKMTNVIEDVSC